MKRLALVAALFAAGCGSSAPDQGAAPAVAPRDPQLAAIQTALTELLERMDVMNDRITRLENAAVSSGTPATSPARSADSAATPRDRQAQPQPAQPQRAIVGATIADQYRSAIAMFAQNRTAESRAVFQKVFDADPSGDLADNALFWIGETYYAAADYTNAMTFYRRVSEEFGDQNKAPDALFKLALAHEKTGDLMLARQTLQSVISRYPYSSTASSARAELNRIKY
jgi:tol-pal system protein YbgF